MTRANRSVKHRGNRGERTSILTEKQHHLRRKSPAVTDPVLLVVVGVPSSSLCPFGGGDAALPEAGREKGTPEPQPQHGGRTHHHPKGKSWGKQHLQKGKGLSYLLLLG